MPYIEAVHARSRLEAENGLAVTGQSPYGVRRAGKIIPCALDPEFGKDLEGKGFDPRKLLAPGVEAIKETVREKMELFGSIGKA